MEKRIVKVGADPFPPYQYIQDDGTPAGSDYECVKKLFAAMGYEIELTIKEWSEIQGMVDSKELDAAFQVQETPERAKKYKFSALFRNAETQVVTSDPELRIDSLSQIAAKNLTIGLIQGYVNGDEIDSLPAENKKLYSGTRTLLLGISKGEVDIGVFDKGVKEYLMADAGIENIYAIDNLTFVRPLSVIFHNTALRDEFNKALAAQ